VIFQAGAEGLGVTKHDGHVCNVPDSERAVYTVFFPAQSKTVPQRLQPQKREIEHAHVDD
jgi:hypothetical protein